MHVLLVNPDAYWTEFVCLIKIVDIKTIFYIHTLSSEITRRTCNF